MFLPLLRACSPEDSEHTDLPLPAPSSPFQGQSTQCAQSNIAVSVSNCMCRSRSLPDLTGHLTARADDGHALPLGSSSKVFSLTFILPSLLVRFSVLNRIKPHAALLVCAPANSLKFQSCDHTSQAVNLMSSLRHYISTRDM